MARNKCLISIILMGALRTEEVITLSVDDINLKDSYIDIGKQTNRQRRIEINSQKYKLACQDWLAVRKSMLHGERASLLFFTDSIQPITKRKLHKIISKAMIEAGINKVHMGTEILRQTAIANMLSSGKTIEEVQTIIGIKTLKNIQKYHQ